MTGTFPFKKFGKFMGLQWDMGVYANIGAQTHTHMYIHTHTHLHPHSEQHITEYSDLHPSQDCLNQMQFSSLAVQVEASYCYRRSPVDGTCNRTEIKGIHFSSPGGNTLEILLASYM